MKLPNFEQARIREEKIIKYLLNLSHPDGASKAKFFLLHGFTLEMPDVLNTALREHAQYGEVIETETNSFGIKYVLRGSLICPDGTEPLLRSVWIIENENNFPDLVTAYPL